MIKLTKPCAIIFLLTFGNLFAVVLSALTGTLNQDLYTVSWETKDSFVHFTVSGAAEVLLLGLSSTKDTASADVFQIWRDTSYYVADQHTLADNPIEIYYDPTFIFSNDDIVDSYFDGRDLLRVTFKRPLVGGDAKDVNLDQCIYIIWAYDSGSAEARSSFNEFDDDKRGIFSDPVCFTDGCSCQLECPRKNTDSCDAMIKKLVCQTLHIHNPSQSILQPCVEFNSD